MYPLTMMPGPFRGYVGAFTGLLMIVFALVLLIACTNAASLLLARAYGAGAGDGDAVGTGRGARATGAADAGGEPDAGRTCRSSRRGDCVGDVADADGT